MNFTQEMNEVFHERSKKQVGNKRASYATASLSLLPNGAPCSKFDHMGIAQFPLASPEKMGFRVVDNCTEEHIQ